MRLTPLVVLAAAAAVTLTAWPADAQNRSRSGARVDRTEAYPGARTRTRTRTRITVRRPRSYLNAGTEVLPMSQPYTDYAVPPGYRPFAVVGGAATPAGHQNPHWPLPGPFELPGFDRFGYGP